MGWRWSTKQETVTSAKVDPSFFVQLLGIPLIAFVLTAILIQIQVDCLPLWVTDSKLNPYNWDFNGKNLPTWMMDSITNSEKRQLEDTGHFDRFGMNLHLTLFLGALLIVYSWDLIMDILSWEKLGKGIAQGLLVVAVLLLIAGFATAGFPWIVWIIFSEDAFSVPFGLRSLVEWFLQDWGTILVLFVGGYGFLASKKHPFLAMVSPMIIAVSITLLLFMPRNEGFWWFGELGWVNETHKMSGEGLWRTEVQEWRTQGLMLYFIGFFMMNVLLIQQLEKSKDRISNSPNVWLLFAVNFSDKKISYRQEDPELSSFPKFWWVPYFWLLVSVVLILVGLSYIVQGDNLLEDNTVNYYEWRKLNLYFQRYAFRAMGLGVYYGLLLLFQSAIQWKRIYRLLVESGLLILVL